MVNPRAPARSIGRLGRREDRALDRGGDHDLAHLVLALQRRRGVVLLGDELPDLLEDRPGEGPGDQAGDQADRPVGELCSLAQRFLLVRGTRAAARLLRTITRPTTRPTRATAPRDHQRRALAVGLDRGVLRAERTLLGAAGTSSRALSSSTVAASWFAGGVDLGLDGVRVVAGRRGVAAGIAGGGHRRALSFTVSMSVWTLAIVSVGSGGRGLVDVLLADECQHPGDGEQNHGHDEGREPAGSTLSSSQDRGGDQGAEAEEGDEPGTPEQARADAQPLGLLRDLGLGEPDLVADQAADLVAQLPDQLAGRRLGRAGAGVAARVAPPVRGRVCHRILRRLGSKRGSMPDGRGR